MAFGNSFASFVDGFVGGRDTRHKWEDRKAAHERQKVLDEYEAERQKRLAETHGWSRDQHGWAQDRHGAAMDIEAHNRRMRDQQWGEAQDMRGALSSALGAAEAGMAAPSGSTTGSPVEPLGLMPPPGPIEQAAVAAAAAPLGALPGSAAGSPTATAPSVAPRVAPTAPPALGAAPDVGPLLMDRGDGKVVALRIPRDAEERRALAEAAKAGRLTMDDEAAARQDQIDAAGAARQQEGAVARTLRRDEDHEWGLPGGAGGDIREAAKLSARGVVSAADAAVNMGLRGVRQVNAPVNAISKWISGKDFGSPSNADTLNRNAPIFPDAPVPKAKEQEVAAVGAEVVQAATATPAGEAAANAMPDLGVKPGAALSPTQMDRAATSFMQSYRDNGLPIITKELMKQGKFAEAESLRTFVQDAAAQEGMKAWSGAVFAAMSGDIDTAASRMIDAYNSAGYFDDGFEIVKDQTSLIRADDGEVMGLRLAMRNQQTGEVTVQESEVSDLIQRGLWLLSPEKAMEQHLAQQTAIQTRLMEMDAERRKVGADLIRDDQKAANTAALKIYEAHIGLDGQPGITYEEALAMASGAAASNGRPDEAMPPMLRRPG